MELRFVKMEGAGNDFVVCDGLNAPLTLAPADVRRLTNRHLGVGADGVIVVDPASTPGADATMTYFNADGTRADMCGNGVRCVARYLHDIAGLSADTLLIDTLAGLRRVEVVRDRNGAFSAARVSMGEPRWDPATVPVIADRPVEPEPVVLEMKTPWGRAVATCLSMGNPHAVCRLDEADFDESAYRGEPGLDTLDVDAVGSWISHAEVFPEQANVEFVEDTGRGCRMRVYERGCAETLACGTGACAVGVTAIAGGANGPVTVTMPGGSVEIAWRRGSEVVMTGPANVVFAGTIELNQER